MTSPPVRWNILRDWRERVRWFAAEFLVVVAGILVALWLQAAWLWQTVLRPNSPVPVTGTINGLISTGDLRLIESDSLRAAILAYASSIESAAALDARTTEQTVFGLKHELAARFDLAELEASYYSPAGLDSIRRSGALLLAFPGSNGGTKQDGR